MFLNTSVNKRLAGPCNTCILSYAMLGNLKIGKHIKLGMFYVTELFMYLCLSNCCFWACIQKKSFAEMWKNLGVVKIISQYCTLQS